MKNNNHLLNLKYNFMSKLKLRKVSLEEFIRGMQKKQNK